MEVKTVEKKLKKMINHLKSDGNTHQNTSAFFIANTIHKVLREEDEKKRGRAREEGFTGKNLAELLS